MTHDWLIRLTIVRCQINSLLAIILGLEVDTIRSNADTESGQMIVHWGYSLWILYLGVTLSVQGQIPECFRNAAVNNVLQCDGEDLTTLDRNVLSTIPGLQKDEASQLCLKELSALELYCDISTQYIIMQYTSIIRVNSM